jgi:Ran GTPase-activating protein (RanGAP) involved in mRNA processing and transport
MPVDVTDPNEFNLFFDYLKRAEVPPQSDTIFIRGAMFPDGRMDLCKQVVGPTSIERLCDTVIESKIVKHFLLGNNVALQENEEAGARAFARMIKASPLETLYLAGNNIGSKGIKIIAEALESNEYCKALWLKRNPIGPLGALSLNAMLKVNTTLVLLDLHNCALGDTGVANLLSGELPALKHLYLDANGLESTGAVVTWCQTGRPVTLFLSINRLGDQNVIELARALTNNGTLKRLCLASTHLGNAGVSALVEMALTCPKLRSLDLGCYKSTGDLGEHPGNFYDDTVILDLIRLLETSPSLKYLSTMNCKISAEGLASLPRVPWISFDLGSGPWHHVHEPGVLRTIKQPKRVVHIDSIYRGKM